MEKYVKIFSDIIARVSVNKFFFYAFIPKKGDLAFLRYSSRQNNLLFNRKKWRIFLTIPQLL